MATAADVIEIARREIGYREAGNNHTKYAAQVPALQWAQNQPWCHIFISWLFLQANDPGIAPCTASCLAGVKWFKDRGRWYSSPKVGDIVYYGPGGGTHVELVVGVTRDEIETIGGNTSGSLNGRYYNGDGVYRKQVSRSSSRIYGYGRPAYSGGSAGGKTPAAQNVPKYPGFYLRRGVVGSAVRTYQARMRARGWRLDVDGIFGAESERITMQFQHEKGLEVDGVVGPATWRAAWVAEVTP